MQDLCEWCLAFLAFDGDCLWRLALDLLGSFIVAIRFGRAKLLVGILVFPKPAS